MSPIEVTLILLIMNQAIFLFSQIIENLLSMTISLDQVSTILNPFKRTKHLKILLVILQICIGFTFINLYYTFNSSFSDLNNLSDHEYGGGLRLNISFDSLKYIGFFCEIVNILAFLITLVSVIASSKSE